MLASVHHKAWQGMEHGALGTCAACKQPFSANSSSITLERHKTSTNHQGNNLAEFNPTKSQVTSYCQFSEHLHHSTMSGFQDSSSLFLPGLKVLYVLESMLHMQYFPVSVSMLIPLKGFEEHPPNHCMTEMSLEMLDRQIQGVNRIHDLIKHSEEPDTYLGLTPRSIILVVK